MENSGNILFNDDTPQWYVALENQWIGPLRATDVYEKIVQQQLSWAHYIWREGQTDWKRICDVKTFQIAVPHQPTKSIQKEIISVKKEKDKRVAKRPGPPPPPLPGEESSPLHVKCWYLYYNDTQFGPFSKGEIQQFLKTGKIHSKVFIWKDGMKNWERIERLSEFQGSQRPQTARPVALQPQSPVEQRLHPRRPLVAKILMSDEQALIVGVCRDVSIGGMQVLTEKAPGRIGTKLKMNISPSSQDSEKQIEPFMAEGEIVRILEDGRGFSFRFYRLNERARQAIEAYIESSI